MTFLWPVTLGLDLDSFSLHLLLLLLSEPLLLLHDYEKLISNSSLQPWVHCTTHFTRQEIEIGDSLQNICYFIVQMVFRDNMIYFGLL